MPAELDVDIEHQLDQLVSRAVDAITSAVATASRELRETHIPAEAPVGATGALSSDWVEREVDPLTRIVNPGTDAWYAHIVARGRRESTPRRRKALRIGDGFAAHASGTSGDPFDERALAATEARADGFIAAALADEGLT